MTGIMTVHGWRDFGEPPNDLLGQGTGVPSFANVNVNSGNLIDAKGDLLTYNGTNFAKLAAGPDETWPIYDSSTATGFRTDKNPDDIVLDTIHAKTASITLVDPIIVNDTSQFVGNAQINTTAQLLFDVGAFIDNGITTANTFVIQFAGSDRLQYDKILDRLELRIDGAPNPDISFSQTATTLSSSMNLVLNKNPTLNNSATDFLVRNSATGVVERRTSINPFDQSLNTTDFPEFRTITLTHNTLTNIITSDYSSTPLGALPKMIMAGGDGSSATNSILGWYTLANTRANLQIAGGNTIGNTKFLWNAYVDSSVFATDHSSNGANSSFKLYQSGDSLIFASDKVATDSSLTWVDVLSIDDTSGVTIKNSQTLFSENINVDALRDGPGGAGYINFVDGARFADGSTPITLSRYNRDSASYTWTGGVGFSVSTTILCYRIGNLITVKITAFSDTQTTASTLSTSVAIPSDFRPDSTVEFMQTILNSGTATVGFVSLGSSGLFSIAYYNAGVTNTRTGVGIGVGGLDVDANLSFVKS